MNTPLSLITESLRPRKLSQTERILRLLKKRGNWGASNRELEQHLLQIRGQAVRATARRVRHRDDP